jgi:hypothetical protein
MAAQRDARAAEDLSCAEMPDGARREQCAFRSAIHAAGGRRAASAARSVQRETSNSSS